MVACSSRPATLASRDLSRMEGVLPAGERSIGLSSIIREA